MAKNWKKACNELSGEIAILEARLRDYEVQLDRADAQRAKIPFAFAIAQRITVPNSDGVQGIIVTACAGIGTPNSYLVSAMTHEGRLGSVPYDEAVLLAAQSL